MERIDEIIQWRNAVQLLAENICEHVAQECWIRLGVANRHIERVLSGVLPLEMVEQEIDDCFKRVRQWLVTYQKDGIHRATIFQKGGQNNADS